VNVEVLVWDPIMGRLGRPDRDWTQANRLPLTEAEADLMVQELLPCVDDYRGQGLTLHGVRKVQI
jgi:hypothetical protein